MYAIDSNSHELTNSTVISNHGNCIDLNNVSSVCTEQTDAQKDNYTDFDVLKTKDLSLVCHNINRLHSKLDEVRYHVKTNFPVDIYGVVETFLNSTVDDSEICIDNYNIIRRDRVGSGGGGIVVHLKDNLSYKRRTDLEIPNIETLFVELHFSNGNFLVGFVYRPPNSNLVHYSDWLKCMDILPKKCHNENKKFILLGDFNFYLAPTIYQRNTWINTFQNYNLSQLMKEPTRITAPSKTLIDHIYVSEDVHVSNSGVLSWCVSDHNPVYVTAKKSNDISHCEDRATNHKTITYRKYNELDIHSMGINMIQKLSHITSNNNADVEKTTNSWTSEIAAILARHCPKNWKKN